MILPNGQRKQVWERTKFYNLYSMMGLYCRNPEFRIRMCILARSLPYLPSDKLLDLSAGRGVVFTGLWVCKVLVVAIWVVPEGDLGYGLVAADGCYRYCEVK
jgi:hypothetical protein